MYTASNVGNTNIGRSFSSFYCILLKRYLDMRQLIALVNKWDKIDEDRCLFEYEKEIQAEILKSHK